MQFSTESPRLTVMLCKETPEETLEQIRLANQAGAEAYGLQAEWLAPAYQNAETYKQLFAAMGDRPCYTTYYRGRHNAGKSDEDLARGLVELAQSGAALVDVMGDLFCKHPEELTEDATAIACQQSLINEIHCAGASVLMSSHVYRYTPAERVMAIATEQKRRGADVAKIVTGAETMEQQLENLRITDWLKRELGIPFLFLSGGECDLHRKLGIRLGCCMALCVYEHDEHTTPTQPLLSTMKTIRETF